MRHARSRARRSPVHTVATIEFAALIKACLTSAAAHSQHGKEKGAATKTAPRGRAALNRKHRDDSVTAIDDDDLVVDNEVHVSTPFRVDLDQGGGTATTRTLVGTAVPTLMLKLTLEARGPLETTVLRIVVRCSVVSVLEP